MYSCSSFTDVTGGPGYPHRDQRAATHPGCGPRTGYLFCLAGLVKRDLYTERLKTACRPITFTSDREGFVLNIHTSLLPLLLPLLLSLPNPHHHPMSLQAQMASAIDMSSGCSQRLGVGGLSNSIKFNWTLEHIKGLHSLNIPPTTTEPVASPGPWP